ncbi:hypothetical protein MmTuc01_3114 [Methanosarcina mazei Tuc01]|uniref:Uncharacterized protein n=1 Tax=Methanosarcina mazei Tuc01 TaxID=1236903 RepID=M1Q1D5_METMZ|nr:hypothetical protein MmTuc01_3114 [Methanosarcina mazei Tuc01]
MKLYKSGFRLNISLKETKKDVISKKRIFIQYSYFIMKLRACRLP